MTQTELAQALGVRQPTVSGYVARGMPTDSLEAARAWLDANLKWRKRKGVRVRADDGPASPGTLTGSLSSQLMAVRLVREQAEARSAQLRTAELEGALVSVDAVRRSLARGVVTARDMLMTIAPRLAPVLAAESDPARVADLIESEVRATLAALAADPFGGAPSEPRALDGGSLPEPRR